MTKAQTKSNKNIVHDMHKGFNSWDEAIAAARNYLLRARVRQREMEAVIRDFRKKKRAGTPFPC